MLPLARPSKSALRRAAWKTDGAGGVMRIRPEATLGNAWSAPRRRPTVCLATRRRRLPAARGHDGANEIPGPLPQAAPLARRLVELSPRSSWALLTLEEPSEVGEDAAEIGNLTI